MSLIKKLFTGATVACCLSASCAYAGGIVIEPVLNLAPAPVYAAPAPVYVTPSPAYVAAPWVEGYDPHHRRHDRDYWRRHHEQEHWDHHER